MADVERFSDDFFFQSAWALTDVCAKLREEFNLAGFSLDHEKQKEWGLAADAATRVHVSHTYAPDTLHGWNSACPAGCNYAIHVTVLAGAPGAWTDAARAAWREGWLTTLAELADGGVHG